MSNVDEMGLTPEAARAYESYFLPAIFSQWPPVMAEIADIVGEEDVLDVGCGTGVFTREALNIVDTEAGDSIAWPFALGAEGKLAEVFNQSGVSATSISVRAGRAKFPSIADFVRTEIGAWLLADAVDESMMAAIIARSEDAFAEFRDTSGTMDFPFNATIAMYAKPA